MTNTRDQYGERNPIWRGDKATYAALHYRVTAARGKPQHCEGCGRADSGTKYEWASVSGNYADLNDYRRFCVACHRRFDRAARNLGIDTAYAGNQRCAEDACTEPVHARGVCRRHYERARWHRRKSRNV